MFQDEDFTEGQNPMQIIMGNSGETISLRSKRQTPISVVISSSVEANPERDAIMLEAVLSTSIDPSTWVVFTQLIFNRYIAPQLKDQTSSTTYQAAIAKAKKKRSNKETKEDEDFTE